VATAFDDCSSLTDWEEAGATSGDQFSIVSGAIQISASNLETLKYTGLTEHADGEILFKAQVQENLNTTYQLGIVRGVGTSTVTGYTVAIRATALRIYSKNGGTYTEIDSDAASHSGSTDYWIRLRANGTTISAATSAGSGDPPSTWINQTTNSTYTDAGFVGFQNTADTSVRRYSAAGIGTNGDTAPSAASGGATNLTIADSTHSHSADNAVLTSSHLLTVADATHAHSADNLDLSTAILLALADALHGHTADNLTLTLAGSEDLVIADASHAHTADSLTLTTLSVLVVAEALHSHLADNVVLSLGGSVTLTVADALHGHIADNIALTSQLALLISDAIHSHAAENLTLSTQEILAIADALHSHVSDNVVLWFAGALTLTPADIAAIADAVWSHATALLLLKLGRNKTITDPVTGLMTVYDDDGTTILLQGQLYEDAAGSQPYQGKGAERRERLA